MNKILIVLKHFLRSIRTLKMYWYIDSICVLVWKINKVYMHLCVCVCECEFWWVSSFIQHQNYIRTALFSLEFKIRCYLVSVLCFFCTSLKFQSLGRRVWTFFSVFCIFLVKFYLRRLLHMSCWFALFCFVKFSFFRWYFSTFCFFFQLKVFMVN